MPLAVGSRLGCYEVLGLLGAGRMGEVYRAADTRLKRQVAIKVLPDAVVAHPDRLTRFQREAEVLASLNHLNIAGIYGLEESDGTKALIMELVEGPTLADRIAQGPVPLDETLRLARQLADALEAAHEQGIVHRDLKPANIKVRDDGIVKVLDFGLAKALQDTTGSVDPENSPTISSPAMMTGVGVILGTAAYMAPEQARGRRVDRRADVWAFGCVLYELLAGRRPFLGDDVTDTIVAVVSKEPDWTLIPTSAQPLLRACLEKDPRKRLRDIADAWRLIDAAQAGSMHGVAHAPARAAALAPWILSGFLVAGLAGMAWVHFGETAPEARTIRFAIPPPEGTLLREAGISPDGRLLAFSAVGSDNLPQIWIRSLDSPDAQPLPGTQGTAGSLFWSPDSRYIGFAAEGALKKVDVIEGSVQTLCPISLAAAFRGGAWNRSGLIVFAAPGGLMKVPQNGGVPTAVTSGPHASPAFLPDWRNVLYYNVFPAQRGIYVASVEHASAQAGQQLIATPSAASPNVVFVMAQSSSAVGHILFERDGALMAQRYDASTREMVGEPARVAADLAARAAFAASSNGVLVYRSGTAAAQSSLLWVDRRGTEAGQLGSAGDYGNVTVSTDGKVVAVSRVEPLTGSSRAWTIDVARGVFSRLNPGDAQLESPQAISPDGRVAFTITKGSRGDIFAMRANSVDPPELLVESETIKHTNDWSHDGRFLIYDDHHPSQRQDLWVVQLEADRTPIPFLVTPADETLGQFSPDGRWVAYSSDESGRREVYVRGFDPDRRPAAAVGQWLMSPAGGDKPRWSRDGTELFYIAADGKMMAVPVKSSKGDAMFEPGVAVALFDTRVTGYIPYDVAPDGRFLINTLPEATSQSSITVVVNWQSALK